MVTATELHALCVSTGLGPPLGYGFVWASIGARPDEYRRIGTFELWGENIEAVIDGS